MSNEMAQERKPPAQEPIGLHLQRTAKALNRAFEDALAEAGGSLPTWLILLSLKSRRMENQRELADAVGIRAATLTHHLAAMEGQGIVERIRDPANKRIQRTELTRAGEELFARLAQAAMAFDAQLRKDLSAGDEQQLRELLGRLRAGVPGA
jgi:MarR family transcriptional regulator for hemolysin